MKPVEAVGIFGITSLTIAGAVLGFFVSESHGILARLASAIVGGIAGLFVGLNAVHVMESIFRAFWDVIVRRRRKPPLK